MRVLKKLISNQTNGKYYENKSKKPLDFVLTYGQKNELAQHLLLDIFK